MVHYSTAMECQRAKRKVVFRESPGPLAILFLEQCKIGSYIPQINAHLEFLCNLSKFSASWGVCGTCIPNISGALVFC